MSAPASALRAAIEADDPLAVERMLEADAKLKSRLDGPLAGGAFGETALIAAVNRKNRETIDVLLRAGASINQKSHWWAGGFHVLDGAWQDPSLSAFLIDRGAIVEIHQAVRLGMLEDVRRMVAEQPDLVHARGGDGQTPLHVAQTIEMADVLLSRGADVNARDVDHESTPAQYLVRDRQEVARFLLTRGAHPDILMTAALGDIDRTRELLDRNPETIRTIVSDEYFPKRDRRAGGTIYNWTLGTDKSPHEVARDFGHHDVLTLLMSRTPDDRRLSIACELGDETLVEQIVGASPRAAAALGKSEHVKLAAAARNNKTRTVALMLKAGWPVDVRGAENATPLHWAAFHGNTEMVRALIAHGADPRVKGDVHDGSPLDWARHGADHGWQCRTGDYPGVIDVLERASPK